jgi:hypothetical protein
MDHRNTSSFSQLESLLLGPYQFERKQTKDSIEDAHARIVELTKTINTKLTVDNSLKRLNESIKQKTKDLTRFVKNNENKAETKMVSDRLTHINNIQKIREEKKATINQTISRLKMLSRAILNESQRIKDSINTWKSDYSDLVILKDLWPHLSFELSSKVNEHITTAKTQLIESLKLVDNPNTSQADVLAGPTTYEDIVKIELSSLENIPTTTLKIAESRLMNYLVKDDKQQKAFTREQQNLAKLNREKTLINKQLENIQACHNRIVETRKARREYYSKFFELLEEEGKVLEGLYKPLKERLSGVGGTCGDLEFFVHRKIRFKEWIDKGKNLFDCRVLKIDLEKEARAKLLPIWENGINSKVVSALTDFYTTHWEAMQKAVLDRYKNNISQWKQEVAGWMYSVDHINLEYGIRYNNVHLDQLSSGTKGIVLLLLYLVIDIDDNRPLLIDQPEENLDPNSIFEELVGPFREICKRRQVIIITHNPNLVVNTDADQVIIANMETPAAGGLPLLSYKSGSIENKSIRDLICTALEGGEEAFLDREKRYRIESR